MTSIKHNNRKMHTHSQIFSLSPSLLHTHTHTHTTHINKALSQCPHMDSFWRKQTCQHPSQGYTATHMPTAGISLFLSLSLSHIHTHTHACTHTQSTHIHKHMDARRPTPLHYSCTAVCISLCESLPLIKNRYDLTISTFKRV